MPNEIRIKGNYIHIIEVKHKNSWVIIIYSSKRLKVLLWVQKPGKDEHYIFLFHLFNMVLKVHVRKLDKNNQSKSPEIGNKEVIRSD